MQTESRPFNLELTVQNHDFQTEWRRCNMVANYIADYAAYQFAQRERAENLISTITNELLETVVRVAPEEGALSLHCIQTEGGLHIDLRHQARTGIAGYFCDFVNQLKGDAVDALYLKWLTTEAPPPISFNQLGLVMLVHDFGACIKTDLEQARGDSLHTQVFVPNKEFFV